MSGLAGESAILLLQIRSSLTLEPMRLVVESIASEFPVQAISGVYRRKVSPGLLLSMRIASNSTLQKLQTKLDQIKIRIGIQDLQAEVSILVFGQEIFATPQLTVPSPRLVESLEALSLACEVGGEMVHPVLETTLADILQSRPCQEWGEFFARGKSLLPQTN